MSQSFADLGVSKTVCEALASRGFTTPFAIQHLVIGDVLAGRDVLAKSPTGSGKTLAFAVPIADRLEADQPRPAALVLAPTRARSPWPPCTAASASRSRPATPAAPTSSWPPRAVSSTCSTAAP